MRVNRIVAHTQGVNEPQIIDVEFLWRECRAPVQVQKTPGYLSVWVGERMVLRWELDLGAMTEAYDAERGDWHIWYVPNSLSDWIAE